MKPKKGKRTEKIITTIGLVLACIGLLAVAYRVYDGFSSGAFQFQHAMEKIPIEGEDYCCSDMIDENKGVAFINYDCIPVNRVTKGIKECKGRYYIFANKINGKWIVDEDSKQVIW